MPLLFKIPLLVILTVLVQYAEGNQRIVYVTELISDEEDFITSGEDDKSQICCVHGNCFCNSLDHALANLSSNVLINITTDVTLSSLIKVSDIENVTIIGYDNPTVNCKAFGGIHFTYCHNCIIQDITWNKCGTEHIRDDYTEPGLKLSISSNISFKNCIFQHSKGQAVLLSEVSGDVSFNHCNFVHNNHYRGHGAAIHFSASNVTNSLQLSVFTISDCNFTYNNHGKSLVYIKNTISKHNNNVTFCSAKFCHNKGVSVYAVNQNIYLNGKILFQNNTAQNGTGIYINDHSTVIFGENSDVTFTQNFAMDSGGTIFLRNYSNIMFDQNSVATFNDNKAPYGGAIYSEASSNITFKANCKVTFNKNSAKPTAGELSQGGAIHSNDDGYIFFEGNSSPVFSNNTADYDGGAIYSKSYILFEGNSSPAFSSNTADFEGGAIYSKSYILFEGNSSPVSSNNTADLDGGAIYSDSSILFEGNSSPVFSNNTADNDGGAIYSNSYILFDGNSSPVFSNNNANLDGGAIYSRKSYIHFEGNSSPVFSNNTADDNGGAMYFRFYCHIIFKENSSAVFIDNTATNYGGALYSILGSNISFEGFSAVVFRNNIAENGGAVFAIDHSDIIFSDNSTVTFTDNDVAATVFSNTDSKIIAVGNSTVIFNDLTAKWCNNTCLPYTAGEGNVVTIDSNGIVWCSDPKAFICLSKKCYCKKLEDLLDGLISNTLVNITDNVTLSSVIVLQNLNNISIIGYNNITVICVNGVGGLILYLCRDLTIEGITWIRCGNYHHHVPVVSIQFHFIRLPFSNILIQKCTFQYSLGIAIELGSIWSISVNINRCNFMNNNHYKDHGTAIYCKRCGSEIRPKITIANCSFSYNGDARSIIYFDDPINRGDPRPHNIYLNNSNFHNNRAISVYLSKQYTLYISGEVLFENNVAENGAGICISVDSTVIFHESTNVKFTNNSVYHSGAAIFLSRRTNVIFEQNSIITFNDNKAMNGTVYSEANSNVTFKTNCEVTFNGNSVTQYGAAIYSFDNSYVTFTGQSKVTFSNNLVSSNDKEIQSGGTIFSERNGFISFEGNSLTVFNKNTANVGPGIFSISHSRITFKDSSMVTFNNNIAEYCGALTSVLFSSIIYKGNTKVKYNSNKISCTLTTITSTASAMCTFQRSDVLFSGHSLVTYTNNTAGGGGAIVFSDSNVIIEEYSTVTFNNNIAAQSSSGGAFTCYNNSNVTTKGNSNVTFNGNQASQDGGAIYLYDMCRITFMDNSTSTFINNTAINNGGAILIRQFYEIMCKGNSTVIFNYNTADNGGTFYLTNSTIIFNESSNISFYNNEARRDGGAGYFGSHSKVIFGGISTVRFDNNKALYGGAILANDNSHITLTTNSVLLFVSNEATQSGGAGYFNSHCSFIMNENALVTFDNNTAFRGGAVCIDNNIKLIFKENCTVFFYNNLAAEGGGAMKVLKDSNVTLQENISIRFANNSAQYGGAIFLDTTAVMVINNSYEDHINFTNNNARVLGNSLYQDIDIAELCNSCLNNRITGMSNKLIATPPNELKFKDPARCIDNSNDTQCNNYYIPNIMLGREIVIPVCVLDYYNQSVDSIQFLVHETYPNYNYFIKGPKGLKHILISCDTLDGISIIGNKSLSKSTNFSITITLNTALYSNWRQISVNLIFELSPCLPGFWQYPESMRCECYNAKDIVFCSGSSSTIKRGYWFGSVTGKPTVTFCPINYCNFTCCETSNGYYHLSPARDNNQCRSHRSGTACGSCKYGYTLSFDSTECINIDSCTAGQTILVILLTVTYWIVMVTLVFAMMYYKVGIAYLYSITYYYSIVDILLNQSLPASRGLYLTVSIISSFSKITPQFLGELCFITKMSGIDQQFIHYIHPSAVILILVIITFSARRYRRISTIISRGIIHVICLLLLLSYTSITSTSLLLMRSLTFHGIDKVYTYLSPDIEYLHGRHLAYGIVALICTVTIVLGLPLLLTLEPFLNFKINFTKIKPLLDQFQGCYKDKYRCFAGYYMICRLVIITIVVIANSVNEFVANYSLTVLCGIIDLIHVTVKPYNKEILNKLDGIILHLIIFIATLRLLDDIDSSSVLTTVYALVLLPLLIFFGMTLFIHKDDIKKIATQFRFKHGSPNSSNDVNNNNNEAPMREFDIIVDESARQKVTVTICDNM